MKSLREIMDGMAWAKKPHCLKQLSGAPADNHSNETGGGMNHKAMQKKQQALVDAWTHPEGTSVTVRKDDGSIIDTKTRSGAWMLGGHSAVIMLDGISGCYSLERVTVRD